MLLFGILWAVLITFVKHHSKMSADTIISVFSSTSIALGLVVLSRGGAFAKYSSVLVGDVLSVAQSDLLALLLALAGTVVCWMFLFNPLLITSVNAPLAQSRGIPFPHDGIRVHDAGRRCGDGFHPLGWRDAHQLAADSSGCGFTQCRQERGGVYAHERHHCTVLRRGRPGAVILPQYQRGRGDCALLRGSVLRDPADAQKITLKTDISAHIACLRRAVML